MPTHACMDPESFVRGGPTLTLFFLVDKGKEDLNTTKSGPSSAHLSETPFMIFQGGPEPLSPLPSRSAHVINLVLIKGATCSLLDLCSSTIGSPKITHSLLITF